MVSRRLIIVMAQYLPEPHSSWGWLIIFLVLLSSAVTTLRFRPYQKKFDNYLEVGLTVLLTMTFFATLISHLSDLSPSSASDMIASMNIVNVVVGCALVVGVLLNRWNVWTRCWGWCGRCFRK
jgi:phosphatidylserine synthase